MNPQTFFLRRGRDDHPLFSNPSARRRPRLVYGPPEGGAGAFR